MATFTKEKSGKWKVRIRRSSAPTITKTFQFKADAEIWAREVEQELLQNASAAKKYRAKDTLKEVVERYLNEIAPSLKGFDREKNRLLQLSAEDISAKRVYEVDSSDIANIKRRLILSGKANSTINKYLSTISSVFSAAIKEWGYTGLINPVSSVKKMPKDPGRDVRLTIKERNAIASIPVADIRIIAVFALETSARLLEITSLKKANVDLRSHTVVVHDKVGQNRGRAKRIPLTSRAIAAIKEGMEMWPGEYVFSSSPKVQSARVSSMWQDNKEKWGFRKEVWFKDLRHEAISTFFEKGLSVVEVMSITGHTNPAQLDTYTHLMHQTNLASRLE